MRKTKAIIALALALIMALMPITMLAGTTNQTDEPVRVVDGVTFVRIRDVVLGHGARVQWESITRAAIIILPDGTTHTIPIEHENVGGFIEGGVSWVPLEFVMDILLPVIFGILPHEALRVPRIDTTLWDAENFADVREARYDTSLPHGEIAVNYIQYISENLGARSAFTYRELETAVWIVEELLAMGHNWHNIQVQEFTYWDIQDHELGLTHLLWDTVTSPHILGVGREYQLREDRVSQNVILTLPGRSRNKIIVGAHYDSPPYASASDNASGTALLLESAQRMLELDHYYTIVYVFFGAEEVGLLGAYYYLNSLSARQERDIVLKVNADVLIEGPHIIYGAAALPEITHELMTEVVQELLYLEMDEVILQFEFMMEQIEAMILAGASVDDLPFYDFESYLVALSASAIATNADAMLMQAVLLGIVEPYVNRLAAQVSAIAAALTREHDFEFISLPHFVGFPSDHLAFLFAGHTVVNLVGLEQIGVLDADIVVQLTRYAEFPGELTGTILHTPLDEFHTIEEMWPGMMNTNMEAFMLFLEAILTGRF